LSEAEANASVDVTVRLAQRGDAAHIAQFNVAMARETENKGLDPVTVSHGVERMFALTGEGVYVVAEAGGEVIAALMITYEWSDWRDGRFWWVQSVYVEPAWRRRGVFRRMYRFVQERAAADADVCGIRLYVEKDNHAAQRTYAKLGMEATAYLVYEGRVGG